MIGAYTPIDMEILRDASIYHSSKGDTSKSMTLLNPAVVYEMQYENSANLIVHHEMNECDFERNAGGDRVAMEVNKRVEEKGWICNITDTPTESNKEARIFQCSNWILKHVVFKDKSLYTAKEQYGIMMNQLLGYSVSGKNKNDDVPDVFSNFALRMNSKERVRKTVIMQGIL